MGAVADLQQYLAQAGLVDGSTNWPSVRRRVHDASEQLVILTEDGGFPPQVGRAEGIGDAALKQPAVQVRVRGAEWDSDAAETQATAIFDALHGLTRVDMGESPSTRYELVECQSSQPVFLGFDEKRRPEFTMSFRMVTAVVAAA